MGLIFFFCCVDYFLANELEGIMTFFTNLRDKTKLIPTAQWVKLMQKNTVKKSLIRKFEEEYTPSENDRLL